MAKSDLCMASQLDPLRTYPYPYQAAVLMDDHKEGETISELSKAISFKPDLQLLHLRAPFHDSMDKAGSSHRVLFFWILERFRYGFAAASKKEETKGRENQCFE
ncbi:hypothetical protein RHSIM_Rhsim05G0222500 [Rhododendron simsii]|uniref:Uncharacterized protein n=1 Tax=Rhododendron simsii TaxID=118357 RepID=A0A834LKV5_RHOSS|nr:hypothetical protein RHSIM_Rhsim05G0222500 [Rhododendron simsii]